MPPNRTEQPTTGPDDASPAAPASAASPASGGGLKAWLPLAVTVAVMPVLAYAMTSFVLLPKLQKGLGAVAVSSGESGGEAKPRAATGGRKESVTMNKLLVNVSGTMGSRYLLVSLSLSGSDPELKAKLQEYDPQLRDMACGVLRTKTLVDLEKPTANNLIRSELITGFNNILGETIVQDIYFTEFAIQ
jgi:flagellar FliL protein